MKPFIYEVEDGWAYQILSDDDRVLLDQPFDPYEEGFTPMTNERASQLALDYIANYVEPVVEPPIDDSLLLPDKIRLAELETANSQMSAELAEAKNHLLQSQTDMAGLILTLIEKGIV